MSKRKQVVHALITLCMGVLALFTKASISPSRAAPTTAGDLDPASSWPSRDEHMAKYMELANRFIENYKKFASPQYAEMYEQIRRAGPRI